MYILDSYRDVATVRDLIMNVQDPFAVFNSRLEVVYANAPLYQFIEDTNTVEDANHQLDDERLLEQMHRCYQFYNFTGKRLEFEEFPAQKALRGEFVHNGEIKLVHKLSKHSTYFYVSTRALEGPGIREKLFIIMFRDVTNLVENDQARKDFIQIAAHEMRTPITSIKGFTQLIYERYKERKKKWYFKPRVDIIKDMERDKTFLEIMLDEVYRLDQLTDELLSMYKLDQGRFNIEVEKVEIEGFVAQTIKQFHISNDFHQISFQSKAGKRDVLLDRKQISRVIHNLLANAVKYSPASPDIYVWVEHQDDHVLVAVQDQGMGIPDKSQSFIFERFYRVEHELTKGIPGYGIGLHLCREIVRLHGGDIYFTSTLGVGSTFYFQLPVAN